MSVPEVLREAEKDRQFYGPSGGAKWEHLEEVVDDADLVLYDLKHMDSSVHEKYTGRPNGLILENARKIAGRGKQMIFRVPLIGGVNADAANIEAGRCRAYAHPFHAWESRTPASTSRPSPGSPLTVAALLPVAAYVAFGITTGATPDGRHAK